MYYASDDELHRLYVCPSCNHYVKTVDLRKARRVIQPMVERLLTVGMDLAAQQEGYKS
jgi:formate dehydrogenase maturation protein FdhE